MAEQPKDILTGHEYDGIQEYDNPTPGWWWAIFWVTILISPPYFFIVLAAQGVLGPTGQYERQATALIAKQFAEVGELQPDEQTILEYAQKDDWMAVARNIYIAKCVQCHGIDGQGLSGPNLTDDHYVHVTQVVDIVDVLNKGRNNGTMPGWENQLHPNEIVLLSSYVAALRGTNAPGRAPEGEVIAPWPEVDPNEEPAAE